MIENTVTGSIDYEIFGGVVILGIYLIGKGGPKISFAYVTVRVKSSPGHTSRTTSPSTLPSDDREALSRPPRRW